MAERKQRKGKVGIVVSDRMDKTVVVSVQRLVQHPLYNRRVKRTKRFKAHDATNSAHTGDRVRIVESRPMSKEKHWRVEEILGPTGTRAPEGREQ